MSWESSQTYYRELNRQINQQLGGLHSAKIIMVNVDFAPIEAWMNQGNWDAIAQSLIADCLKIQQAGADFLMIATNTIHKLAPQIDAAIDIPLLHIADAVAHDLGIQNKTKVGLLGTAFTMEQNFYKGRLYNQFNIETIVPEKADRQNVNRIIFEELCHGQFKASAKQQYLAIIEKMAEQGAEAIILACTEIGLLINQTDTDIPLLDATYSHIQQAVEPTDLCFFHLFNRSNQGFYFDVFG